MKHKSKSGNLAQSLGRITHVKSKTITWLKSLDKLSAREGVTCVSAAHLPPVSTLAPLHPAGNVTLRTPVAEFPQSGCCLPVQLHCSFCEAQVRGVAYEVMYNSLLPLPFVITCEPCSKNGDMR